MVIFGTSSGFLCMFVAPASFCYCIRCRKYRFALMPLITASLRFTGFGRCRDFVRRVGWPIDQMLFGHTSQMATTNDSLSGRLARTTAPRFDYKCPAVRVLWSGLCCAVIMLAPSYFDSRSAHHCRNRRKPTHALFPYTRPVVPAGLPWSVCYCGRLAHVAI